MVQTFPPATFDYGYPDLENYDDERWLPDLQRAVTEFKQEIEEISSRSAEPTVENTLVAVGSAGREFNALLRAFSCVYSADAIDSRVAIQPQVAALSTAHQDWMQLHTGLNARLKQLQQRIASGAETATDEQRWMLQHLLKQAQSAGATLSEQAQDELLELNQQLAAEEATYQQLQTRELAQSAVLVDSAEQLQGLSAQQISSAAAAAQEAGHSRGYLLRLTMPVQQPMLAQLEDSDTRRKLFDASVGRGTLTDDSGRNTYEIGARIAVLRAKKAELLGAANYLETVLPLRTAPTREAIESMLEQLSQGAASRLNSEITRIREESGQDSQVKAWDMSFWIRQLKPQQNQGTEFPLDLEQALERVFSAAKQVYGVSIKERTDLPGFVPGARCFEVFDGEPGAVGEGLGLFLLDAFSRPTKSGGAWMNAFSVPSSLTGSYPVVINCLNISPAAEGERAQITAAEQKTLFHEFGHGLHGLLAEAQFPQLAATAVPRDNVEFPSQVNEVFQDLFNATGPSSSVQPSEDELWGRGLSTTEHLAAVVIDLGWHTLSSAEAEEAAEDPRGFEHSVLQRWGLDQDLVPPRYSSGFFKHIFASSGYAAGYYSYLWAEVLAKDAGAWFREVIEKPDQLRQRGEHFRRECLARGNTRDPLVSFEQAVGHSPDPAFLMRSLGLA